MSSEAVQKFGYYVYLYVDPFDDSVFYVGKGNRAFQHLEDQSESRKVTRIRQIRGRGKEPRIEILVHGLKDEETALRVEAAVIDLLGVKSLTNDVRGWRSGKHGRREIRELEAIYNQVPVTVREPAVLIRITRLYRYGMTPTELYDATRSAWKVGPQREKAQQALAVHDGIVREVYRIKRWFPAGTTFSSRDGKELKRSDRWEFVGALAEERLRRRYIGKSVAHYFPQGSQNPITYINLRRPTKLSPTNRRVF